MDVTDAIQADRATRDFTNQQVSKETIELLISNARTAGSGHNREPWTFIVIQERERLDALADFGDYTTPLQRAPTGIVLAIEQTKKKRTQRFNIFDAGRAAQNLMLTATANGLGTVPQGFNNTERVREFLHLPASKRVFIGFAVGHPVDTPSETIEGVDKEEELDHMGRKPLTELLHWETYG